jgi:hypothetical protein
MKRFNATANLFGVCMGMLVSTQLMAQNAPAPAKSGIVKKESVNKTTAKKTQRNLFSPQSEETQALAAKFQGGTFHCEFNQTLTITANAEHPGYLTLKHKKIVANMLPVPTSTGALRLESKAGGLVWLQLPSKSMLMNSKIGQRLADDCQPTP